jgi:hypothetical protein
MGQFSAVDLIARIGDAVIERFRGGAIEFLVHPEDPTKLRLCIRFADDRDCQDDLAQLSGIAMTAGVPIEHGWASRNLIAIEMPVRLAVDPADRVLLFKTDGRKPRLASGI